MKRYMLDTNIVSHLLRHHPAVSRYVVETPMAAICISAITEGELLFGLARRPAATQLHRAVREFLRRVDILPWDTEIAQTYGTVRARLAGSGKSLGPLDLLIAAHALARDAVLVTNDHAFRLIKSLQLVDWTVEDQTH